MTQQRKSITLDEYIASLPMDEQEAIHALSAKMTDMNRRLGLLKQALPESMRDADVDETPDGSWIMEWFAADARLAVYLTEHGRIGYAYAAEGKRSHGEFDCCLPELRLEIVTAAGALSKLL